jgi:propionyl-CoA synthetase
LQWLGVSDQLKGQEPVAFAVVKDQARVATPELRAALEAEIKKAGGQQSRSNCPAEAHSLRHWFAQNSFREDAAPLDSGARGGTRSGDLTTIDDPSPRSSRSSPRWESELT